MILPFSCPVSVTPSFIPLKGVYDVTEDDGFTWNDVTEHDGWHDGGVNPLILAKSYLGSPSRSVIVIRHGFPGPKIHDGVRDGGTKLEHSRFRERMLSPRMLCVPCGRPADIAGSVLLDAAVCRPRSTSLVSIRRQSLPHARPIQKSPCPPLSVWPHPYHPISLANGGHRYPRPASLRVGSH
jgi:hypothetical protein